MDVYVLYYSHDYEGCSHPQAVWVGNPPSVRQLNLVLGEYMGGKSWLKDGQYESLISQEECEAHRGQTGDDLHLTKLVESV